MPKRKDLKKILVIGAGPIIIGQACEFDYSGTQACKALKDEGYKVILINSNPATIMTDPEVADKTYIEPITLEVLEEVIKKEKPDAIVLERVKGDLSFENVNFGYSKGSNVLKNINIEVPRTSVTAILGAPGSGKTSLVHLIPRFYDINVGSITIDGVDIRDVTLSSLRRNVGIVMQDVFIFTSTIRANIAYGAIDAPEEQIIEAAKLSQMHEFITSMPDGYDSYVGERGTTLSGGQRQRLAIARTILLDPPSLQLNPT